MYNIYCDESCHLENDKSPIMLLGAVQCDELSSKKILRDLRILKNEHNLKNDYELKWTKVRPGKMDYFKSVIDYFFENQNLKFRVLVADKTQLNHSKYHQSHDEWYYKMYYLLLREMFSYEEMYSIYLDVKDTRGVEKTIKLKEILNKSARNNNVNVTKIQLVRSHEVQLIQLSDFLIGSVGYINRNIQTSDTKNILCEYIQSKGVDFTKSTPKSEKKFNIFMWKGECD